MTTKILPHCIAIGMLGILLGVSCKKETPAEPEPEPTVSETYSDMQITEFSYAEIPVSGGNVAPNIAYKYKVTLSSGKVEERTSGALLSFTCSNDQLTFDSKTGLITAVANTTVEVISYDVEVTASIEDAAASKSVTVTQSAAANDVISSEQYLEPLELLPHTAVFKTCGSEESNMYTFDWDKEFEYQSFSKNGIRDKSFLEYVNDANKGVIDINFSSECSWMQEYGTDIEYVSVNGTDIEFVGGRLFRVDTYRSGVKDTVLIASPTYFSETLQHDGRWRSWDAWLKGEKIYHIGNINDPDVKPAVVNGNTWHIFSEGTTRAWCTHTLTSNADGQTQSITIKQNDNIIVGIDEGYVRFTGNYTLTNVRDSWPEIEDYPVGSTPKWIKTELGDYWPIEDTKSLHPDSDRYVHFIFDVEAELYSKAPVLMTRDTAEHQLYTTEWNYTSLRGGITITADADIPTGGGNTRHESHTSRWEEPEPGTWDSSWRLSQYAIELPNPSDATEDFEWTLKFDFYNEAGSHNHWSVPSDYPLSRSNVNEVKWNFPAFKVQDKRSTIEEWIDAKKMSGIFGTPLYTSNRQLGDIIDGVPNPKEE